MKKLTAFIITACLLQYAVNAQQNNDAIKTALLIVDIQNFYFPGDGPGLSGAVPASLIAREVLELFREKEQLVVHVRHKADRGYEIHENVEPASDEKVITKDEINSFQNTDLLDYLRNNEITRLVIIGMQTHMCLEAATRAAHDFGFECVVIQDACATRDVQHGDKIVKAEDVHASTLASLAYGGYAKVIDMKELRENMDMYLFKVIP